MDTSTRADRVATAHRLSEALRRTGTGIDDTNETPPAPPGDCGRPFDDPRGCGMKIEAECKTHADVSADDPALLSISGTRRQARAQLRVMRRYGLTAR